MTRFERLALSGIEFNDGATDTPISGRTGLTSLRALEVDSMHNFTADVLEPVANIRRLQRLRMAIGGWSCEDTQVLEHALRALQQLRYLDMAGTIYPNFKLHYVAALLNGLRCPEGHRDRLAHLVLGEELPDMDDFIPLLMQHPQLRTLELKRGEIGSRLHPASFQQVLELGALTESRIYRGFHTCFVCDGASHDMIK